MPLLTDTLLAKVAHAAQRHAGDRQRVRFSMNSGDSSPAIAGVVDVVNNLGTTQPVTSPAPQHGDTPLQPEQFLDMLTKPEDLVNMLAKPGEFISSAYDFAEQLLTAQRKFAEGMVEAAKPLLSGTQDAAPEKDDAR